MANLLLKVEWGGHHAFPTKEDDGPPPHGEEDLHFLQFEKEGGDIL